MKAILESGKPCVAEGATGTVLEVLLRERFAEGSLHADAKRRGTEVTVYGRDLLLAPLQYPDVIRELHRRYISAGATIIKTATFSANLIDIPKIDKHQRTEREAEDFCRILNRSAAALSLSAAKEFGAMSGPTQDERCSIQGAKAILTAGSIGPGSLLPSLDNTDPRLIHHAYEPQIYGLLEGGVDILLIETVQDILHCKTLLALIREASLSSGRAVPVMVSATLTASGTLLCGTELEAFTEIIAPYDPLAIGLNCSGGPLELEPFAEELSRLTKLPISIMPNAGLPVMRNSKTVWPMEPAVWADSMLAITEKAQVAIAGGCCGTTPEHIASLARLTQSPDAQRGTMRAFEESHDGKISAMQDRSTRHGQRLALASLYKAHYTGSSTLIIDERANTQGSKAFKDAVGNGNLEEATNHIIRLAETESQALDLAIARPGKDDAEIYESIILSARTKLRQAIVVDTMSESVFEKTLALVPGKALMNSINLENEDRARRLLRLAKRYGAAVVLLAMDHNGPAKTANEKIEVSRRLFDLARSENIRKEDIFFDTCTFPILSAGPESARATLEAIKTLKAQFPKSGTILGVGNVSYGLARKLRAPVTAFFFHQAREAGLDAAIINPKTAGLVLNAEETLLLENFFYKPDSNLLREYYEGKKEEEADESAKSEETSTDLGTLVLKGRKHRILEPQVQDFLASISTETKIETVLAAMREVAQKFDLGKLSLPEVMLAAETAKLILAGKTKDEKQEARRSVILATVKGDLHDIGKNMVSLVLEAGNIKVIDLGIDVEAAVILAKAKEHRALAIGVSGLLTRSLPEMQEVARLMKTQDTSAVLLCGGAAVSAEYVSGYLDPLLPGKVFYGKDPFEALALIKSLGNQKASEQFPRSGTETKAALPKLMRKQAGSRPKRAGNDALNQVNGEPTTPDKEVIAHRATTEQQAIPSADFSGTIALHEILEAVNFKRLIHARLKYGNFAEGFSEAQKAIELAQAENIRLAYRGSICACSSESHACLNFVKNTAGVSFSLPCGDGDRSIVRYFRNSGALFCCTLGKVSTNLVRSASKNTLSDGVILHALFAELAEAGAELVHGKLKAEARAQGGKRYSFGFPGAPGVESNAALLEFLNADKIGLRAAPSGELVPEYSITAMVSFDPGARYLDN